MKAPDIPKSMFNAILNLGGSFGSHRHRGGVQVMISHTRCHGVFLVVRLLDVVEEGVSTWSDGVRDCIGLRRWGLRPVSGLSFSFSDMLYTCMGAQWGERRILRLRCHDHYHRTARLDIDPRKERTVRHIFARRTASSYRGGDLPSLLCR